MVAEHVGREARAALCTCKDRATQPPEVEYTLWHRQGVEAMTSELEIGLYIFILAGFLGYHVISRVPPLLHTPLMSATNAMSGISLVGSLVVAGSSAEVTPSTILGFIAVVCSSTNVVGGFLITDRMLRMFKK